MALYTQDRLADTLKTLMREKPLDDITVQELVDRARVNRKTFYYHYHGISDLINWMYATRLSTRLDGIDIDAPDGSTVTATRGGTVESVETDDLYGTVVTIDHGDGTKAVYASLAPEPPVATGDSVEAGYIIGAVGTSALAEVGQGSHLHFAVFADGQSVDPLYFLQAA